MKLNKKGFTLIELLAVIVILAIILVIAVPGILTIQANAKRNTTKDEALLIVKAVELCVSSEQNLDFCKLGEENSKISNYYDKKLDESTYTLGGTIGNPTIDSFEYTDNGYTISSTASASTKDIAVVSLGSSISETKENIKNVKFGE